MPAAVDVAREVLVSLLGEPEVSSSGYIWKWKGGKQVLNRAAAAKLFGRGWHKVVFDLLAGQPMSFISEQQFLDTFELSYNARTCRLTLKCDRSRWIDGLKVTFEGKVVELLQE